MKPVVIKTYKGDRAAERGIAEMRRQGYEVDQSSARKQLWSPATGVFTRKQKHTITFRLVGEPERRAGRKHWWQEPTLREVMEHRKETEQ